MITLGAAGGYILLSLGLLIWCRIKRRQRKMPPVASIDHSSPQTALRNSISLSISNYSFQHHCSILFSATEFVFYLDPFNPEYCFFFFIYLVSYHVRLDGMVFY